MRLWLVAAGGCLLVAAALFFARAHLAGRLYDQRAARTWSADGRGVSQLSVFWPYGATADGNAIGKLEYDIRQELVKASVADGDDSNGADFVTCMSAAGTVSIAREGRTQPVTARAIGTGGDFFRFHPLTLLNGSLYPDDLLTPDRILLDDHLAWQLFGSFDIAGKTVSIGGVAHTVAGVFHIPRDGMIERDAGIPDNLCFLSIASLCQFGTVGDFGTSSQGGAAAAPGASDTASGARNAGASGGAASAGTGEKAAGAAVGTSQIFGIGTWEIVMPDPVKNFAVNLLRDKVNADRESVRVVENSARFAPAALKENLHGVFTRGMQTQPVVYPYWENIARGYTNLFSLLWALQTALTVFGCAILAVFAALLWRRRTWTIAGIWRALMDKKYDFESRMRNTHDKWEHF